MKLKCSIVVRRSLRWKRIKTMPYFRKVCTFDPILPFVEKWNKALDIPYWDYRAEMKRIAQKTLRRTELHIIPPKPPLPRKWNHILIPIDDDDWLAPDIADAILPLFQDPKVEAVCWPNAWFRVIHNHAEYGYFNPKSFTHSCSYAVRSALHRKDWFEHTYMERYRKEKPSAIKYFYDRMPSMYIRHFGAVGVMKGFDRFIDCFPLTCKMPEKISRPYAWSEPYASELLQFIKSIRHKSVKLM